MLQERGEKYKKIVLIWKEAQLPSSLIAMPAASSVREGSQLVFAVPEELPP